MLRFFTLVTGLGLISPVFPVLAQAVAPVAQAPADLPTGERWLKHFREDLLPFWNVPDAWGFPRGNFPTFRGNDGHAVDWVKPPAELATAPGWIKENFGREYVRMKSRQTYFYGVAYHLTGDPEMLELARKNAAEAGVDNVEFVEGYLEDIPLPDGCVDVVLSNCVINLAPDKQAVFCEIVRVLKPGGRLAVSDIALKKPLPPEIGGDLMAYVGCIAGAILIDEYRRWLIDAGFAQVDILDTGNDLNAYAKVENQSCCCPPPAASSLPLTLNSVSLAATLTANSTATTTTGAYVITVTAESGSITQTSTVNVGTELPKSANWRLLMTK